MLLSAAEGAWGGALMSLSAEEGAWRGAPMSPFPAEGVPADSTFAAVSPWFPFPSSFSVGTAAAGCSASVEAVFLAAGCHSGSGASLMGDAGAGAGDSSGGGPKFEGGAAAGGDGTLPGMSTSPSPPLGSPAVPAGSHA